jgi:PAS domain S-box-containing protein
MELPISRASSSAMRWDRVGKPVFRLVMCMASVFAVTAVLYALPLRDRPSAPAFAFLFLVYTVSATWGFRYAVFFSCLAALAFSWLLPPVGRFWVSDPRDVFILAAFFVMAIITSELSNRARREASSASRAGDAARRSEEGLREVIETMPAMAWSALPDGSNTFVNRQWAEYAGLSDKQTVDSDWRSAVHPEDLSGHMDGWHQSLATGLPFEHEVRLRRTADGQYRWFLVRGIPLRNERDEVLKWYGIATDIEDRKQAEEALRKSEERWRSVFDNSAIGVSLTDPDGGRFLATNHVFQTLVGYTEEELRALSFSDLTHEDYREAKLALITELLEGKRRQFQMEKKYRRKDGSLIWVSVNVSLVPGTARVPRFLMALSEDITEHKRAEQALRQSEAYLAEAQRLTHTGSWALNLRTGARFWSQETFRIFDFDPEKVASAWDFFVEMVHPEDRPEIERRAKLQSTQHKWLDSETDFRIVLPDGTIKHLHSIAHPTIDRSGEVIEVVGTVMDVTERKNAEEKLRRSEEFLLQAQRLSHTGSWRYVVASGAVIVSPEFDRIFGVQPDEYTWSVGIWLSRIHPEDQQRIQELFERNESQKTEYEGEYRIVLPDGAIKHLHGVGYPVLSQSGELVEMIGTTIDVTERKRAEEERERLRRLEADLAHMNRVSTMGELAASIAHEVNQPLSGIVSNASASLRFLAGNAPNLEEVREAVRDIVRDGKRAGEIIARVRALTTRSVGPGEKLDLNETIQEVLTLVADEAKRKKVIVRTQFADDLSCVAGDRVQLQQVVLNLVMNAIEAMSNMGGRERELVITTRNNDADQVQATVEDSGIGIDPTRIDKIFDSFYTTKAGGMGMGLSISRSILQAHGGRLWVEAKDRPGTMFHFAIPKYHEEGAHAGATRA